MITGAYKTTNVQVLEHEASISPLDLHLEMLAISHVHRAEGSPADQAVQEACKAVDRRAQRRFRTRSNIPKKHTDQFRTKDEPMGERSCLAGRSGNKTATKRELEETWKARWTEYQQQSCAAAKDSRLSVAARATWSRRLRTKENLTRAESTVGTLLRNITYVDRVCLDTQSQTATADGRGRLQNTLFCSVRHMRLDGQRCWQRPKLPTSLSYYRRRRACVR